MLQPETAVRDGELGDALVLRAAGQGREGAARDGVLCAGASQCHGLTFTPSIRICSCLREGITPTQPLNSKSLGPSSKPPLGHSTGLDAPKQCL